MRTIVFSYLITNIICVWFVVQLWRQNRNRFAGTVFWVIDFLFQAVALFLIVMRGAIPDWISMLLSNTLVISGAILGFVGQERFLGKIGPQIQNYLLVILFISVHSYFALIQPNLAVRNLNIAVALLLVCFQSVWLMWRRVEPGRRSLTFGVGMVNLLYCLVSSVRIVDYFAASHVDNNYFHPALFQALVILSYQVLFILLTYSFVLMVNKRLIMDVGTQEEKFSKAFNSAPYAIMITRPSDGKIIEVNEKVSAISGYGRNEILENSAIALHLWERDEDRAAVVDELSKTGKVDGKEARFRGKNGEAIVGLFSAEILPIDGENFILSSIADITERKHTEDALRQSEASLSRAQMIAHLGNWEYDIETGKTTWSDEAYRIFGFSPHEVEVTSDLLLNMTHPEDRDRVLKGMNGLRDGSVQYDVEYRIIRRDGTERYVHSRRYVSAEGEDPGKIFGMVQDITDRRLAEEESRFQSEIMTNMAEAVYLVRVNDGVIVYTNSIFENMFGYGQGEMLGKHVSIVNAPSERNPEETSKEIMAEIDGKGSWQGEVNNIRKDGTTFWCYASVSVFDHSKYGRVFITLHTDITERKRVEEALKESERFKSELLDIMNDTQHIAMIGSWEWNVRNNHVWWSDETYQIFGVSEQNFVPSFEENGKFIHPDDFENYGKLFQRAMLTGEPLDYDFRMIAKSGQLKYCHAGGKCFYDDSGQPLRFIGTIEDITERKLAEAEKAKLEAQNRQLMKSESLGRMAGAIAHTFNNQLAVVIGSLEMAIDDLPKDEGPVNRLSIAMQAAGKAANMSGMMLTYLGQISGKRDALDLSECCLRDLPKLRAAIPENIILETDFLSPGPIVSADVDQIQKVLSNLVTNAWEAIGNDGGSIHLGVKTVSQTEISTAHRHPIEWQPQNTAYACLEVTDTGVGIAHKDIESLFDPFFSSKFTGRGLGLAVALGIVRSYSGVITVESKPGRGSKFQVFLPVATNAVIRQPNQMGAPPTTAASGTILLVEDEEMLRDMAASMVTRLGYSVIKAKDGVEAMEIFRQHKDEIRLVISDLTMPRMNGWETLTVLRKLVPGIPVILASGYDKAHVMAGDHPELPQVFLGKPYKLKELGDAIRQALVSKK